MAAQLFEAGLFCQALHLMAWRSAFFEPEEKTPFNQPPHLSPPLTFFATFTVAPPSTTKPVY